MAEGDSWPIPEGELKRLRQDVARCARLKEEDPFAQLPAMAGGYSYEYWIERAAESGHALAGAFWSATRVLFVLHQPPSDERNSQIALIQKRLAHAVRANDPEINYYIGHSLLVADNRDGPMENVRGVAWMLMACRAGVCADDMPEPTTWKCPPGLGRTCDPLHAAHYELQQRLGPEKYARAVSLSYEIEDLLSKKAWRELDLSLGAQAP